LPVRSFLKRLTFTKCCLVKNRSLSLLPSLIVHWSRRTFFSIALSSARL
jgi:hypothetical protein